MARLPRRTDHLGTCQPAASGSCTGRGRRVWNRVLQSFACRCSVHLQVQRHRRAGERLLAIAAKACNSSLRENMAPLTRSAGGSVPGARITPISSVPNGARRTRSRPRHRGTPRCGVSSAVSGGHRPLVRATDRWIKIARSPSPGAPGEGRGEGFLTQTVQKYPHPDPSPGVPGEGERPAPRFLYLAISSRHCRFFLLSAGAPRRLLLGGRPRGKAPATAADAAPM